MVILFNPSHCFGLLIFFLRLLQEFIRFNKVILNVHRVSLSPVTSESDLIWSQFLQQKKNQTRSSASHWLYLQTHKHKYICDMFQPAAGLWRVCGVCASVCVVVLRLWGVRPSRLLLRQHVGQLQLQDRVPGLCCHLQDKHSRVTVRSGAARTSQRRPGFSPAITSGSMSDKLLCLVSVSPSTAVWALVLFLDCTFSCLILWDSQA